MSSDSPSRLYLASASPRRRELLEQIGVPLQVLRCEVDETALPGEAPATYVERIAMAKALAATALVGAVDTVLAADTAVVLDHHILGKPADRAGSEQMLRMLSGRMHQVMTCVVVARGSEVRRVRVDTRVWFRTLSDSEISQYWETGEPVDKAGSYGIQGLGAVFVERLEGSYSGVVGLPLAETAALLDQFGIACWQRP
jgi:septum formation protein